MSFYALIFAFLLPLAVSAAPRCDEVFGAAAKRQLPDDSEMHVYRFYSNENNNSAHLGSYKLHIDGFFSPFQRGTLSYSSQRKGLKGFELLGHLQSFSTHVVGQMGQITTKDLDAREALIGEINPHQVTYVEITRPIDRDEVTSHTETYPTSVISNRPNYENNNQAHIRQAGLWIVAGQYTWARDVNDFLSITNARYQEDVPWDLRSNLLPMQRQMDPHDPRLIWVGTQALPWQQKTDLIENGQLSAQFIDRTVFIDRNKYPIVFEIGRTAQTGPNFTEPLYKAAIAVMLRDVEFMLKAKPSDAYVFVSAATIANSRRLQRMGFEVLEGSCVGTSCILVQSLEQLASQFDLSETSYTLKRLKEVFPKLNDTELITVLEHTRSTQTAELDFLIEKLGFMRDEPIIFHDFSQFRQVLLRSLSLLGVSDPTQVNKGQALLTELVKEYRVDTKKDHVSDFISSSQFNQALTDLNALRLTNLNPDHTNNEGYIPTLLIGLNNYLKQILGELRTVAEIDELIEELGLNFVIQTTEPSVAQAARRFNMDELHPVTKNDGSQETVYTFLVSQRAIEDYSKTISTEWSDYLKNDAGLTRGYWFFRSISAEPIIF